MNDVKASGAGKFLNKRIVIISMVGDIGKSTIADVFLCPRMNDVTMLRVETINSSGESPALTELKYRGDQLDKVMVAAAKAKSCIIDVGTSNVESFLLHMDQNYGSHKFFDYFIVPVLAKNKDKETKDAIKTLLALRDMGVERDRIILIFNQLPINSTLEDECEVILNFHRENPFFTLSRNAVIHESEVFIALSSVGKLFHQVVDDTTDYYQLHDKLPIDDKQNRVNAVKLARAQGTAKKFDIELSNVFHDLFGEKIC